AMHRLDIRDFASLLREEIAQDAKELIERCRVADRDVVDAVQRAGVVGEGRAQVGLDGVRDVAKIARRFAVPVDFDGLAQEHGAYPPGDYSGVSPFGILPCAEDIEVAKSDGLDAVAAGEDAGVELV